MIFAERSYRLKNGGRIQFRFHEPVQEEEWHWLCILEIEWPNGRTTQIAGPGADKLDSLLKAVAIARINLVTNEEWKKGNVSWLDGDSYPWLEVQIFDES